MATVTEQKCPCCGGSVAFDVGVQKLKCPFCDTEFDINQIPQNEDAGLEAIPDSINWTTQGKGWAEGETDKMSVYACNNCGGEIIADENTGASSCPYCNSPVVMKGKFSGALRPDLVIPFKYDKNAAKEALKKHISTKKYVPKAFKDENHLDEIKGVYVPHWLFTGDAYARVNLKCFNKKTWSDSQYRYIETEEYDVFREGNLAFENVPVDGSTKMPNTLMESIEPFDLSQAVEFNTAYLAGYMADKYDVAVEQCTDRANERIKQSAVDAVRKTINQYEEITTNFANLNIANGTYRYALYPVWMLRTSWKGENYTFAMNGQTGKFIGNIPTDNKAVIKKAIPIGAAVGAALYAVLWIIMLL